MEQATLRRGGLRETPTRPAGGRDAGRRAQGPGSAHLARTSEALEASQRHCPTPSGAGSRLDVVFDTGISSGFSFTAPKDVLNVVQPLELASYEGKTQTPVSQ